MDNKKKIDLIDLSSTLAEVNSVEHHITTSAETTSLTIFLHLTSPITRLHLHSVCISEVPVKIKIKK